jgi:hypothetical protein
MDLQDQGLSLVIGNAAYWLLPTSQVELGMHDGLHGRARHPLCLSVPCQD